MKERLLDLAGEIKSCRELFDDDEKMLLDDFVEYIEYKARKYDLPQ